VSEALLAISSSKEATLLLVQRLVAICQNESSKRSHALFAARCLLWLCNPKSSSRSSPAIKSTVVSLVRDANIIVKALEPHHHLCRLTVAMETLDVSVVG